MKLLTSQKNDFYDLIESSTVFTPSQFQMAESINGFSLSYMTSDWRFRIADHTGFFVTVKPGTNRYEESYATSVWADVITHFSRWLKNLHKEVSSLNKWDRLSQEMNNLKGIVPADTTMFSHSEYLVLSQQMEQLKQSLAAILLTPEQNLAIESKLDHLLLLAEKLNKFDWQGTFIGTIISIIITLGVTPEKAQQLLNIIKQVFNGYFL